MSRPAGEGSPAAQDPGRSAKPPAARRLLEQGLHSDVAFVVHGRSFRAHRGVLGARSTYFAHMLDTKWKGKSVVVLRHPLVRRRALGEARVAWPSLTLSLPTDQPRGLRGAAAVPVHR